MGIAKMEKLRLVSEEIGGSLPVQETIDKDTWPDDVSRRVAELFVLLDRWDRQLKKQAPLREAA